VAHCVFNLRVLGRLYAETFEDRDPRSSEHLALTGAPSVGRFAYGTLPTAAPRLVALSLYRWEVITRETVVVGVVGAGGLGQLVNEDLAARDFAAVTGVVIALVVISVGIDSTSAALRRRLR
jgi:phosphonate transport system permease protein